MSTNQPLLPHEQALQRTGLTEQDLPKEIKKEIQGLKGVQRMYSNKKSDNATKSINLMSFKIGNMILDYAERDFADGQSAPASSEPQPPVEPSQPQAPVVNGLDNSPTESDLKEAIIKAIAKEGGNRVYADDLKRIMGKRNIPDTVEVDGMRLVRSWAFYYPS